MMRFKSLTRLVVDNLSPDIWDFFLTSICKQFGMQAMCWSWMVFFFMYKHFLIRIYKNRTSWAIVKYASLSSLPGIVLFYLYILSHPSLSIFFSKLYQVSYQTTITKQNNFLGHFLMLNSASKYTYKIFDIL